MAQYAVLIFEQVAPADLPADVMQAHQNLPARVAEQGGKIVAGLALEPPDTATAIRGETLTDGPFIETKEVLGGVFVLEARDLDHALALALAKLTPGRVTACRRSRARGSRRSRGAARSPPARSTSRACCVGCCWPSARRPGSWRCYSSTKRAAGRAQIPRGNSFASPPRTARRGTAS